MALAAGDKLGPYEVLAPIGKGGMGEVYRARDTRLKREVAIKVLPEAFTSDLARMARFQREAEVLVWGCAGGKRVLYIHFLATAGSSRCRTVICMVWKHRSMTNRDGLFALAVLRRSPVPWRKQMRS
jgi:hypothetical protein